MNGPGILVDHVALDLASGQMRHAVDAIEGRLDQLAAQLAPLANEWQGEAQAAFVVAKARWDTAVTELKEILGAAQRAVAASNLDYEEADRRAARAFGG